MSRKYFIDNHLKGRMFTKIAGCYITGSC